MMQHNLISPAKQQELLHLAEQIEANIKNWQVNRDYELLDSMINRDTFWHDDSLRFGYYVHAIGLLKVDSSTLDLKIKVDTIRLYGDDFGNKGTFSNFHRKIHPHLL